MRPRAAASATAARRSVSPDFASVQQAVETDDEVASLKRIESGEGAGAHSRRWRLAVGTHLAQDEVQLGWFASADALRRQWRRVQALGGRMEDGGE
jgi:hypothetical protein